MLLGGNSTLGREVYGHVIPTTLFSPSAFKMLAKDNYYFIVSQETELITEETYVTGSICHETLVLFCLV